MKPKKIALTGGIATGKSTVARMLTALGAVILDADKVAREVVQPGAPCWQRLHDVLLPDYFEPDGTLKRRKLRECIIRDSSCRARVEEILHPAIMAAMDAEWEQSSDAHPHQPVIFDIPLLYETNLTHGFDSIILVYTPPEIQILRLMARDNLSREEAEETLTMQLPIEVKKQRAQIIIDNSLDLEHTRRQVEALWNGRLDPTCFQTQERQE